MRSLDDLDVSGKRVLVRVDFNVPLAAGGDAQAEAGGVRVERQVFLSRTDEFALLGDVILADGPAKIEAISRLGLLPDWAANTQTRTRECRFLSSGTAVRALPVGLNCPRTEGAAGRLSAAGGHLELSQSGVGGLYAPLVFDWNPTRRRSPAGWRRLTVALAGAAVPASDASGVLLEVGSSKWLIYRSLRPTLEPRSVLGQHTMYETMFGRFVKGDLEPFVQVEQTSEKNE